MQEEPHECFNKECNATLGLSRCTRCRKAQYCGRSCQQADFPAHKLWCKAAGQATACRKCTHVSETLGPGYTVLHCDAVSAPPPDDYNFTWVFHSPYNGGRFAREFVGNRHVKGNNESNIYEDMSDACDTVIVHNGFIHSGDWDLNFAGDGLKNSIEKRGKPCVVCEKQLESGVSCGQCQTPICYKCVEVLVREEVKENPCPECTEREQYKCPACKGTLRYTGQIVV